MLQHLHSGDLGLGGRYKKLMSLGLQGFQKLPNAGVGMIFIFSDGHIPAAENFNGFLRSFFRNAEFDKGFPQGRSYKNAHFLPGWNGKPEPFQRHLGAVDDTLPGIGERSVQIK